MTAIRRDLSDLVHIAAQSPLNLTGIVGPPAWMIDAACPEVDPDLFFPEQGGSHSAAKKICGACPVRVQCLDYAMEYEAGDLGTLTSYPAGIYGGLSAEERKRLRRERGAG